MAGLIERRHFVGAAALAPLLGMRSLRAEAPTAFDPDASTLAVMLGDLGIETDDPLLLLAAIRVASNAGDPPDRLWIASAKSQTIRPEIAAAVAAASPVGTKAPETGDPAMVLRANEEREIWLPPNAARWRLKARLKQPGYEVQRRLVANGHASCELIVAGAKVLRHPLQARGVAMQPPFLVSLPWEGILERSGAAVRLRVRNRRPSDIVFAYTIFSDTR